MPWFDASWCLDTAKAGSAYCRKHDKKPKAPPTSSILAQCSGRKRNGERCKDTSWGGTLYCRNLTAPVNTQSAKTDDVQIPAKLKEPERQQCDAKIGLVVKLLVLLVVLFFAYMVGHLLD